MSKKNKSGTIPVGNHSVPDYYGRCGFNPDSCSGRRKIEERRARIYKKYREQAKNEPKRCVFDFHQVCNDCGNCEN